MREVVFEAAECAAQVVQRLVHLADESDDDFPFPRSGWGVAWIGNEIGVIGKLLRERKKPVLGAIMHEIINLSIERLQVYVSETWCFGSNFSGSATWVFRTISVGKDFIQRKE